MDFELPGLLHQVSTFRSLVAMFCTEKLSIVVEDVECTHSTNRDIECVHSIKQGVECIHSKATSRRMYTFYKSPIQNVYILQVWPWNAYIL